MKYLKTFESFELIEENKDNSYIYNHLTDNIDPLNYESFSKYYQACVNECGSNVPSDIDEFCKDCWEEREGVFNEGHATFKPGALIEFHIPDTNKNHVGRIIAIDDTHITVVDLKTDEQLRLPRKEFGPAYEN